MFKSSRELHQLKHRLLRGFPAKIHTFSSHAFIHRMGTALAFIPLDCVFTPSQLQVSVLPCVDCTSTEVFEQDYLFLTPQLKYGSGKRICPAVSQILCPIAKFHHCSAASKGHHFYVSSSSTIKYQPSFLEPKDRFLCHYVMIQNIPKLKGQHAVFQRLLDRELRFQQCFPRKPSCLSVEDKFGWNG